MKLEHTDLIDRYCRGELDALEKAAFEEKMAQDTDLQNEVRTHQDMLGGMQYFFNSELKSKLSQSDIVPPVRKPKRRFLYTWFAIAASISLFFGLGYSLFKQKPSAEALYQAYYQPYPNIIDPVERSGETPMDALSKAMLAYEKEDYQQAIALFEQETSLHSSYKFYQAIAYLETQNYDKSQQLLQEVHQSGASAYRWPSLWYQALLYLAQKNELKAEEILQQLIEEGDDYYQEKAKELLRKL